VSVSIPELAGIIGTGVSLESLEGWEQPLTQECVATFEIANPDITVTRSGGQLATARRVPRGRRE
jgi:hypothetical protein